MARKKRLKRGDIAKSLSIGAVGGGVMGGINQTKSALKSNASFIGSMASGNTMSATNAKTGETVFSTTLTKKTARRAKIAVISRIVKGQGAKGVLKGLSTGAALGLKAGLRGVAVGGLQGAIGTAVFLGASMAVNRLAERFSKKRSKRGDSASSTKSSGGGDVQVKSYTRNGKTVKAYSRSK